MLAILDICNISPVAVLESEPEREPNDMEIEAVEVSKIAKPSACIRIKGKFCTLFVLFLFDGFKVFRLQVSLNFVCFHISS